MTRYGASPSVPRETLGRVLHHFRDAVRHGVRLLGNTEEERNVADAISGHCCDLDNRACFDGRVRKKACQWYLFYLWTLHHVRRQEAANPRHDEECPDDEFAYRHRFDDDAAESDDSEATVDHYLVFPVRMLRQAANETLMRQQEHDEVAEVFQTLNINGD